MTRFNACLVVGSSPTLNYLFRIPYTISRYASYDSYELRVTRISDGFVCALTLYFDIPVLVSQRAHASVNCEYGTCIKIYLYRYMNLRNSQLS